MKYTYKTYISILFCQFVKMNILCYNDESEIPEKLKCFICNRFDKSLKQFKNDHKNQNELDTGSELGKGFIDF